MCLNPLIKDGLHSNSKGQPIILGSVKGMREKYQDQHLQYMLKNNYWSLIPCRYCLECRNVYARNWAARVEEEAGYHKDNHFITLTYDDDHLPVLNAVTGELYKGLQNPIEYYQGSILERPYIDYEDMQKFMKRLREHAERKGLAELDENGKPKPIRFFGCGEYGDLNGRPHFHIIIFGMKIPDLTLKFRRKGYEHDTSKLIEEIWQKQGIVDIGSVTYRSARYTAQYTIKKKAGKEKSIYTETGLTPPDARMSRRPGIGAAYWMENREAMYRNDRIYLSEGRKQKPPQYYDTLEDRARLAEELQEELNETTKKFKEIEDAEESETKVESEFMRNLKAERRKKANDALFAQLRQTSGTTMAEFFDIRTEKYEKNHKASLDRSKIDRGTG